MTLFPGSSSESFICWKASCFWKCEVYLVFILDVLSYCLSNFYWSCSLNLHLLLFLMLGFFFHFTRVRFCFLKLPFWLPNHSKSPFILFLIFLWISTFLFHFFLSLSFVLSFGIIPQDSCVQCSLVHILVYISIESIPVFWLGLILIKKFLHEILELNFFTLSRRGMFFMQRTDLFYSVLHCQ